MIELKVTKVGSRGYVFSFDDPYLFNIYVIDGDEHIFFCDTGLGSETVEEVLNYLKEEGIQSKPFIVFNSHADYDHVWGNHMFGNSKIIAHELSPEIFEKEGEEILEKYAAHKRGDVVLKVPNQLFKDNLVFEEEGVEFYHTPGHTLESSSCYDRKEQVLFVGDNIETPYPYINFLNLEDYKSSLSEYLTRDIKAVISGHDEVMFDTKLIQSNLDYLDRLEKHEVDRTNFSDKHRVIHYLNTNRLAEMLKNEGNNEKSIKFYQETVEILREADKTPEIETKIAQIQKILELLLDKI